MLPYSYQYAEAGFLLVAGILVKLSPQSHDIDRLQGMHCGDEFWSPITSRNHHVSLHFRKTNRNYDSTYNVTVLPKLLPLSHYKIYNKPTVVTM